MVVYSVAQKKTLLRTRVIALAWIVSLCLLSAWVISSRGSNVNTNLMALLPTSDREEVVVDAVNRVQKHFERHFVVLVGAPDFAKAKLLADLVARQLIALGQFQNFRVNDYQDMVRHAVSFYLPRRFQILSNSTREKLLDGDPQWVEREILRRYYTPQSAVNSSLVTHDPLLLLTAFLEERTRAAAGKPEIRDGYLTVRSKGREHIVLIGELSDSPFSLSVQRVVMPEINRLRQVLFDTVPDAQLQVAGVLPHAAAGTQSGIDEASTVGLGSLAAIVFLLIAMFRSVRPFILTLAAIGLGCVCGFAACLAIFGEVHFLTVVFGSSLVGISVDYSFHYFCDRFRFRHDWSPNATRTHVFPGITLGLITSAIGFAGLYFAPFPGMQGMAVFSIIGLCVAYGCVMLCYPPLTSGLSRPQIDRPLSWVRSYAAWWRRDWSWSTYIVAAGFFLAALTGTLRLTASDDIRMLQTLDSDVMAEEIQIRSLIGRNLASQFLLVEGENHEDFLTREEELTKKLRTLQTNEKIEGYLAISDFVASARRQAENRELLNEFLLGQFDGLAKIVRQIGLTETARETYIYSLRATTKGPAFGIEDWLAHPVSAPHRHLWVGSTGQSVLGVVGLRGVFDLQAVRDLAAEDENIHFVDPAGDISELFGQYRRQTIWLTLLSYGAVLLILIFRYGFSGGVLVMVPPVIATFVTLGMLGLVGAPFSLFNVMAMLLVLGIGVDYSLFFRETGAENPTTLFAIALSSVTTLLAFGLLAFSSTDAIHAFGLTVTIGILTAFLFSPVSGWFCSEKGASVSDIGNSSGP